MKDTYSQITEPIVDELTKVRNCFVETIKSEHPQMKIIMENLHSYGGKQMRPILTLLVSKLFGNVQKEHISSAVIMELTHNASLVHDDVIDEANLRRNEPTLNTLLGAKSAVLVGDFILSRAISFGIKESNFRAIEVAAATFQKLVSGEIEQMYHSVTLDTTEEIYMDIIKQKTAHLLGAAAQLGAPIDYSKRMFRFGELLGIAYQIQDDILDYTANESGKLNFNDIRERKITLPLLYAIKQFPERQKEILDELEKAAYSEESVAKIVKFVVESDAIEQAQAKSQLKLDLAMELLKDFGNTEIKNTLKLYAQYITKRIC